MEKRQRKITMIVFGIVCLLIVFVISIVDIIFQTSSSDLFIAGILIALLLYYVIDLVVHLFHRKKMRDSDSQSPPSGR